MAQKTKEITPIQYAEFKGCWPSYIQRILKAGDYHLLPNVIKVRKYSRFYTLEVPINLTASDFTEVKIKRHRK
jgi:hypothetical protein